MLIAALAALTALAGAATAGASSKDVIKDCYEDGKIDGHYSKEELKQAEEDIPSDVDEYSDCRAVIRAARSRGNKGSGGGTGGLPGGGYRSPGAGGDPSLSTDSGAIAGTKGDLDSLASATRDRNRAAPKVPVAGQPISPASGVTEVATAANGLPTPLIAALIALAAMCLVGVVFATWRRWPQLRRGPLRFPRR